MCKYADSFSLFCVAEEATHVGPGVACMTKLAMGHLGLRTLLCVIKVTFASRLLGQTNTKPATVVQLAESFDTQECQCYQGFRCALPGIVSFPTMLCMHIYCVKKIVC